VIRSSGGGSRSAAAACCLLAALTAAALLRAEAVLTPPSPAPVGTEADEAVAKDAVRRFYAAVNAALAAGDPAPLADAVAPDFVAHAPTPGFPPDRDGLVRALTALRAAAPGLRLTPTVLLADGDLVVAQVAEASAPGAFLGLPLPRLALWGPVDRFRVADGRVVEHWGTAERGWLDPVLRAPLRLAPPAARAVTLERRAYAPGAREDARPAGPRVLYLEAGTLTVAVSTGASPAAGTEATLTPGRFVLVPQGAETVLRNAGPTEAVTLEVTTNPPGRGAARPDGVASSPLAGGVATPLPVGNAVLSLGRVVLPPGAAIPLHATAGPELLAVEAGTLGVTVSGGRASVRRGIAAPRDPGPAASLASGDGVLIEPGAVAAYRNAGDGPLVLLVATLAPAESPPGTPPAAPMRGTQGPLPGSRKRRHNSSHAGWNSPWSRSARRS
jgi:quercetin dioxygenase-like cupin family protein/predicted SnoaL-like aldol condensation-catalyzing enzyme